jgi:hypothetical protein
MLVTELMSLVLIKSISKIQLTTAIRQSWPKRQRARSQISRYELVKSSHCQTQAYKCDCARFRDKRVLTEDRSENIGFFKKTVEIVVEVMVDPQRQIDHFLNLGYNFGATTEPREKMTNVAVVLLDGKGQILAGEDLAFRDEAVVAVPVVGDEDLAFDADFVEELLACGVITATKNPGDGSPSNRVIGPPNPQLLRLFFTKCHISSSVTTTTSALIEGSGS